MKQILLFYFFLVASLSQAQEYEIRFKNGETHNVEIRDKDPLNIPRGNLTINIFKFGVNESRGAIIPFNIDLKYMRLLKGNKSVIEGSFFFSPFKFKTRVEDYKLQELSTEIIYKRYFFKKEVVKKKKLSFLTDNSNINNTVYIAKIPVSFERRYGIRAGSNYYQNNMVVERISTNTNLNITAQRSFCFIAGISRSRFVNFNYTSPTFGENQKLRLVGEMYVDVLVSPYMSFYGTQIEPSTTGLYTYTKTKIDKSYTSPLEKAIGFRFGGYLRGSFIRKNRIGHYLGYEFGTYPSVKNSNFRVSLTYGFTIWGKN